MGITEKAAQSGAIHHALGYTLSFALYGKNYAPSKDDGSDIHCN